MSRMYDNYGGSGGHMSDEERLMATIKKNTKWGVLGLLVIFLLWFVFSGVFTVGQDSKAVVFRFGQYTRTAGPGLNFKIPLGVEDSVNVKTEKVFREVFGFRTDKKGQKGTVDAESLLLTGDLSVAKVEWIVQYQVVDPFAYLTSINDPTAMLRDMSEFAASRVIGDISLTEVLSDREIYRESIKNCLQEELNKVNSGIRIAAIEINEANVPEPVKESFNAVDRAKQTKERMILEARQQYNEVIPKAKGEAKATIANAKGNAAQITNAAEGRLAEFEQEYAEYKKAPAITKKRMYLDAMTSILADTSNTIVDGKLEGILPMLNMTNKGGK